jgi:integrase
VFRQAEIDAIADELGPRDAVMVRVLALTGLRPEELVALERKDVDRQKLEIHIERVYVKGELREHARRRRAAAELSPVTRR